MGQALSPLSRRFVELLSIARLDLVQAPTPLVEYPELGKEIGHKNLWIKCDDLSAAKYGGNKPRKLEYGLADVLAQGFSSLVTVGGLGTNHGLATAIYAQQLGLNCHLVLVEQPITDQVRQNMLLFHRYGARLIYASSYSRVGWHVARLCATTKLHLTRNRVAFIDAGGTSALTNLGFVNAAFELSEQLQQREIDPPTYIFCPVGTGGTMAGLMLGLKLCGLPTQVIGVQVVDKILANRYRIANLANKTLELIKSHGVHVDLTPIKPSQVTILEEFFGEQYGAPTIEAEHAMHLAADHGIKLETTYSAKAFAGLIHFVKQISPPEQAVMFWNTYNSRDLCDQAASVDFHDLPRPFHRFFE